MTRVLSNKNLLGFVFLYGLLLINYDVSAQIKAPVIVMDIQGGKKITVETKAGNKFKAKEGTALKYGASISFKEDQKALVLKDKIFEWMDEKNEFLSEETVSQGISIRSFDPIFADYITASYAMAYEAIADTNVIVKNKKERGDAWIQGDGDNIGGWGVKDKKVKGGWGVKKTGGIGGWGTKKEKKVKSGWGVKGKKVKGGWGVKDPSGVGGWGVKKPGGLGGWGVKKPGGLGGWGVKKTDGLGGWTIEDMIIEPMVPGGSYQAKKYELSWFENKEVSRYLLAIFNSQLEMVDSIITPESNIIYDFSRLTVDSVYYWQVFAENERAISPPILFKVIGPEEMESIKKSYTRSKIFDTLDPMIKKLMQTVCYESKGLYIDAMLNYELMNIRSKRNDLIKINNAAFCMRLGQNGKARALLEKI